MDVSATDIKQISAIFNNLSSQLTERAGPPHTMQDESDRSLHDLCEAMSNLLLILQQKERAQSDVPQSSHLSENQDLATLGDYGFSLLMDLSGLAAELQAQRISLEIESLSLPLALWIARQGGEIRILEPVVNTLARHANNLREPLELEQLYELAGEIQRAVSQKLRQDQEKSNPSRPWRILLLNRAIIATRSHRTPLIEAAYDDLIAHLPEEAPGFFREGMQQMVALNYPQPVRAVVENYYNQWSSGRTLH